MKKQFFLTAIALLLIHSSNAQNFDLATLKFPFKKSELNKFKPKKALAGVMTFDLLVAESAEAMTFNKVKLNGAYGGANDDIEGTNEVSFYSEMNSGDIYGYKLDTYTTAESRKLLKAMSDKFGKPLMDRGSSLRARVWESADQKVLYLLEYTLFSVNNSPKTESASLIVTDKSAAGLRRYNFTGPFQYYGDYIEARSKKKEKYTYAEFLKDMKARGSMSYLKGDNTFK